MVIVFFISDPLQKFRDRLRRGTFRSLKQDSYRFIMIRFQKPNKISSTGRCKFSESAFENCFREELRKIEKINRERCANRCSELEWCHSAEHHLPFSVNFKLVLYKVILILQLGNNDLYLMCLKIRKKKDLLPAILGANRLI